MGSDGRANSLHYKCGFVVKPYIDLYNFVIPRLEDNAGIPVMFDIFELYLFESDIFAQRLHNISITYHSRPLILHRSLDEYLLLSYVDEKGDSHVITEESKNTLLLKIVSGLSFRSYTPR